MPTDMYVYIVTNKPRGTLYIGVTGYLRNRVWQHRSHILDGFTDRYNLERLVWFEPHTEPTLAIQREKSLKRWYRDWKIALIEQSNPQWRDLWQDICGA
jgi:putative endonuclease